jgi:hypothetical protein
MRENCSSEIPSSRSQILQSLALSNHSQALSDGMAIPVLQRSSQEGKKGGVSLKYPGTRNVLPDTRPSDEAVTLEQKTIDHRNPGDMTCRLPPPGSCAVRHRTVSLTSCERICGNGVSKDGSRADLLPEAGTVPKQALRGENCIKWPFQS